MFLLVGDRLVSAPQAPRRFPVSYRDLERMLADRGVEVDDVSLYRWVQRFAPELEKWLRRHLRPCRRGPWHVDET